MNIVEVRQIADGTKVFLSGMLAGGGPQANIIEAAKQITGTSPKCIKPDNPAGNYSFWTQNILLSDSSGRIRVSVNLGNDSSFAFHAGMLNTPVTIEGQVGSFTGQNGITKTIERAKVKSATPAPAATPPSTPPPQQPAQNTPQAPVNDTGTVISRQSARRDALTFCVGEPNIGVDDILQIAESFHQWAMTGTTPQDGNPDWAGETPPPPTDDNIPF